MGTTLCTMLDLTAYLLPCLVLAGLGGAGAACQGDHDCDLQREESCYKNICLNATQIMQLAFQIGKPCESDSDCPEACMSGHLTPAVCGPYLRILRLPGASHPPQCQAKVDCKEKEEECMVRPQGNECITPQHFMEEEFAIGKPCVSAADCPEACYTSFKKPSCGPYLTRLAYSTI